MQLTEFHPGQFVTYVPQHGPHEKGRVKSVTHNGVFVVYKCAGDWERYQNYTAAKTDPKDLIPGWID